ncbi:DUF7519 family protein [Haloarchaeobius sp. HRN-SO-5]|uniref:DUF7519 family protein n=1 Tax=Haloarchaeobius sp. HRN-SO-5 TaxID=3446118 RepID=UPI003EB9BA58
MTDPVVVSKRPSVVSSVLAVLVAAYAISVVGSELVVRRGLLLVVGGLVVVGGGAALVRRGWWVLGWVVALGGLAVAVAGIALPAARLARAPALVDILPGFVGVLLLGLALVPVRGQGSRWLFRFGVGLVFVGVLTSAVVQETTPADQLFAGTLCVVAWDLGENAISVGRQLGRHAKTWSVELTHFAGTAVVAFLAVRVSNVAAGLETPDASLTTFVVLIVGVLLLTAALHD